MGAGHYDRSIAPSDKHPTVPGPGSPASEIPVVDVVRTRRGGSARDQPVSTLRGATVQVDVRQAARVALALVVATLAVLVVVFVVAGIDKNRQINQLRHQGVPVTFTVSNCQGLLGGSGSNGAGYACHGTYRLGDHTFEVALPGTALYAPGATVRTVAVPGDPGLVSPVTIVDNERASWRVFILPGILFVLLLLLGVTVVLARRRSASPEKPGTNAVGGGGDTSA
jgi:hypothetical protein